MAWKLKLMTLMELSTVESLPPVAAAAAGDDDVVVDVAAVADTAVGEATAELQVDVDAGPGPS